MTQVVEQDSVDPLAVVFGRVRRVIGDLALAEEAAVTATARYLTLSGPDWLRAADDATRLHVLTCLEVLRLRR